MLEVVTDALSGFLHSLVPLLVWSILFSFGAYAVGNAVKHICRNW